MKPKRNSAIQLLGLLFFCATFFSNAQTILSPGDIAIIAQNTDDPDQFVFTNLVDLSPGTSITFTDNAWNGTALASNEGTFIWTTSTSRPRGSVISVNPSGISFSTSGDNLFAYQGASSNPTFIFGFSNRPWVTGSVSLTTSRRPSSLIEGSTAFSFSSEIDNAFYNQLTTNGTKTEILSSICTVAKWSRSNSRYGSFPSWVFTFPAVITEPSANPTNFSVTNLTTYSANISFNAASGNPAGYLVLMSKNSAPSDVPADGTIYSVGQTLGNSKVLGTGNSLSYSLKSLRAQTNYFFRIFSYINSGIVNYRQADPLNGTFSTPVTLEGTYYNGISNTSVTFIDDLKNRIRNPYVNTDYNLYDENVVAQFEAEDTTGGMKTIQCAYSGFRYNYTPPFVWYTASPFSREHTWAVSWMPSGGSTSSNEYEDYHNLYTVVQNNANAVRSNYPFGEVVTPTSVYLEGQLGFNSIGQRVYEPRANQKGNVARALFYMALRYDGLNGFDWSFSAVNNNYLIPSGFDPQSVELLLQWHQEDPPDNYDIARNDYISSRQGNRNPFIDHPEWVNAINFSDLTPVANSISRQDFSQDSDNSQAINEQADQSASRSGGALNHTINLYPNPASDFIRVGIKGNYQYRIFNISGAEVMRAFHKDSDTENIPVGELSPGTYLMLIEGIDAVRYGRFVRQ
jgi:endonuclease I